MEPINNNHSSQARFRDFLSNAIVQHFRRQHHRGILPLLFRTHLKKHIRLWQDGLGWTTLKHLFTQRGC